MPELFSRPSFRHSLIRGGVGAKDEQVALTFDFTSNFDWLGRERQDLLVHWTPVAGDEQEVERGTIGAADEEDRRDATADAANGAGPVGCERPGIHHPEVTFAVHDFAEERLLAETDG